MTTTNKYFKTVIYQIVPKDNSLKEMYIGSTINFEKRVISHKTCVNSIIENSKVYSFIRNNGGWDAWEMSIIERYPCKSKSEKEKREFDCIQKFQPTLNSVKTFIERDENSREEHKVKQQTIIKCECGSQCKQMNLKDHLNSDKHKKFLRNK